MSRRDRAPRRGRGRQGRCGRRGLRGGFTLVEVLVALLILATVLVGLAGFMSRFVRSTSLDAHRARATDLVTTRIEAVKGVTRYEAVDGWAKTEAAIPGYPGFVRITTVSRVSNNREDYKVVTVRATSAFLGADTVRKSTVIARY